MSYPPLNEVRKTSRSNGIAAQSRTKSCANSPNAATHRDGSRPGAILPCSLSPGPWCIGFWAQQQWLGFLLALFAHGTVTSFFVGIAPHELGHGTVFRTKWLNKVFMYLFSLISWWDPFDYASSHTYHHRYTLHPAGDRENLLPLEPSLASTFMLQLFTVNLLTQRGRVFGKGGLISTVIVTIMAAFGRVGSTDVPINEWLQALHTDQPEEHRKSIWWSRILLLFHGAVLVIAIVTGLWVLPLIFTVAPFIANWAAYFVGLTQHCGLREDIPDFRKCVRSVTVNPCGNFCTGA